MKNLLPLLFLVACTNIDVLERKLESCERRENEIYEKALTSYVFKMSQKLELQ